MSTFRDSDPSKQKMHALEVMQGSRDGEFYEFHQFSEDKKRISR